jgi:hypothetical protein
MPRQAPDQADARSPSWADEGTMGLSGTVGKHCYAERRKQEDSRVLNVAIRQVLMPRVRRLMHALTFRQGRRRKQGG